jgi:hypothetical protein
MPNNHGVSVMLPCGEQYALLKEWSAATAAYSDAMKHCSDVIYKDTAGYPIFARTVADARDKVTTARLNLVFHENEHGCR